jgi:hypothetical protein
MKFETLLIGYEQKDYTGCLSQWSLLTISAIASNNCLPVDMVGYGPSFDKRSEISGSIS